MRYYINNNVLKMYIGDTGILRKGYKLEPRELKYVPDFVKTYNLLKPIDKKKIDKMRVKYTVYRCWYYAKVWEYTRESVNNIINEYECIDHILPIAKGFKNNINPEYIGSKENIQFITHKENLHKGTKLTSQGSELLIKYTS